MGKFYFETKVLTFFGKRTSLSFYEKCFFFNVKSIKNVLILRKKSSENKSLFFFLIYKRVCYGFYSSFKNPRFKFCHDKEKSFYKNRVQAWKSSVKGILKKKKRKKETQTYFFRKRFLKPKLKHEKRVWLENVFDGFSHKRGFKVKNPCFLFILKNNVRRLFKEKSFFIGNFS